MAQRPPVRRGRKNPNAVSKRTTEVKSTGPVQTSPEGAALFPMQGATDRTKEMQAREELDQKLDAILGKEKTESLSENRVREQEAQGSASDEESANSAVTKASVTDKKRRGRRVRMPAQEAESVTTQEEDEVTDYGEQVLSGPVLFDAVLPSDKKTDVGEHLIRRSAVKVKSSSGLHHKSNLLDEEENKSVTETAEAEKVPVQAVQETGAESSFSIYDYQEDKRSEEERIQAEVERRVSAVAAGMEPQVIVSPRAVKRSRLTVLLVSLGVAALAVVSIILGIRYDRMSKSLAEADQELEFYRGLMSGEDIKESTPGEVASSSAPEGASIKMEDGIRRVYLTFDDGPSEVTAETLDILKAYDVKATFFVNGKEDERSSEIYNRIVDEGHTLAMHGYTHDFDTIYASVEAFSEDLHKLRNLLYDRTGGRVWSRYYRFPGGSSTTTAKIDMKELIAYVGREGITYYDWNVYGGDDIAADTIISNIKATADKYQNVIILLHDAGDKHETVEALPGIIEYLQSLNNTILLPITDDTVPIQHGISQ